MRGNTSPKPKATRIAVLDFETDPFMYGRVPKPFAAEFYSDEICFTTWGDKCVEDLILNIQNLKHRYIIYAHNGGKFDFHFIHEYIDNPIRIINNRIVSAQLFEHTVRDSYAIIPIPLAAYNKTVIEYTKMEAHLREQNKQEILAYLHDDCVNLYKLVAAFVDRFGALLTVGSTAMKQLQSMHSFTRMNMDDDPVFRRFYFGGRVQCFRSGLLEGPYVGYDVNSSYPHQMMNRLHPDNGFTEEFVLPDDFGMPYFAHIEATNRGALPCMHEGKLTFQLPRGDFFVCSHELEVALHHRLVDIHKVHKVWVANECIEFSTFVEQFYAEKVLCKRTGDRIGELFAKFMLNSCYGKFGQNPANYSDWLINRNFGMDMELLEQGYVKEAVYDEFELWARPAAVKASGFYNVAIASSITSGARATLLDGIQLADDPIYCDTDSIICRNFNGIVDPHTLGAWKPEFHCTHVAIAGKKLYAAYNAHKAATDERHPKVERQLVKLASKGGTLTLDNLIDIAGGDTVEVRQDAPIFSLHALPRFLARTFKNTTAHSEARTNEIDIDDSEDTEDSNGADFPAAIYKEKE